ncbi:urea ABC transporter permease subunit UrtC [Cellulomonas dongxiuzhuiae]|uniref:Urea ABC transporter permease subunit UrtC n=1 Tax=Cellulomonas dongxiuzhuiae TaxID=2819979 RepID=A0ABX8GLB1_9CELL|nr:urea ABC transporter permease subunit UrtC [Cellulomonas dongxiuzhuiae]MBO3096311.1 urea ABC transporter permease subunit UrtC [Cellulomonas dongxiuzhuiae]QWC16728.1 urea ABC transporter permease subunit UrtC [Cellulomonas dongxiuzhuiae]
MSAATGTGTGTDTPAPWWRRPALRVWAGVAVAAVVLFGLAPALLSDFRLNLLAKFLCLAMVAVGIGLAWGRGGMLVLGQGVFFGIGGYLMAMHMKLSDAGPGGVPDFLLLYGDGVVPGWWEPLRSPVVTILAILVLPAGIAALLGLAVFRRRVRGAYFAILSQALAAAFAILLVGQQKVTGGTNGLNGFRSFFGYDLADPVNKRMLYFIAAGVLIAMVVTVRLLMGSRYGELLVAVRDQENRVRFLGYDPANVKVVAYAIAACFAGIGGALFAPVVGIISPADVGVIPSIGFLVGVAIGGRATLLGPVLGAVAVSWAETGLSEQFPSFWTYFQGALFILVVAFLPQGFASLGGLWRRRRGTSQDAPSDPPAGAGTSAVADAPPDDDDDAQHAADAARTAGRHA